MGARTDDTHLLITSDGDSHVTTLADFLRDNAEGISALDRFRVRALQRGERVTLGFGVVIECIDCPACAGVGCVDCYDEGYAVHCRGCGHVTGSAADLCEGCAAERALDDEAYAREVRAS